MHIPDGILSGPVCGAAAVVAAGAFAALWREGRAHTTQRQLELVGPTAAVIFAGQLVNVAIGGGTSGHLIGAALAVALIGPIGAMLAMAVVITVQALIFADGGVAALGVNLLLMAIVAPFVAASAMTVGRRLLGTRATSTSANAANAGIAGFASVMAAVLGYLVLHEVGATVAVGGRSIATAMVTTHVGVGVLEAGLTAIGVVLATVLLPSLPALASAQRRSTARPVATVRPAATARHTAAARPVATARPVPTRPVPTRPRSARLASGSTQRNASLQTANERIGR
ncbi:MAG: energy-coupling factor ABC transporter permease [Actinobacteria bacterium]|nr:energy-coupling factor ABC transporter permease [Actinomycetota bacterium]